jgi:GxxExxY protein
LDPPVAPRHRFGRGSIAVPFAEGPQEKERETHTTTYHGERDPFTGQIIGLAIEVYRALGPGLLESAYEECLCYELAGTGLAFRRQVALPVIYKDVRLDCGYRMDIVMDERVVELKTVERILPVHEAQLITYLKLSGLRLGLLLNFHCAVLRDGIRRFVL